MTIEKSKIDLEQLLKYIPVDDLNMSRWLAVGGALHDNGYSFEVFDNWSAQSTAKQKDGRRPRYNPARARKAWETFERSSGRKASGATIVHEAKLRGWRPSETAATTNYTHYNKSRQQRRAEAATEAAPQDLSEQLAGEVIELRLSDYTPGDDWSGAEDMAQYLRALFRSEEKIGYCLEASWDDNYKKWRPGGTEVFTHTCGEVLERLETVGDVSKIFTGINPEAGGWIRVNPVDGALKSDKKTMSDDNITDFRYCLVEADELPLDEQLTFIRHYNLPCAAIVSSGGRSVHAIVKVDAHSREEYDNRVNFIFNFCERHNFKLDTGNKNASRYTRLPGLMRGAERQFLIATNVGADNFDVWKLWTEGVAITITPDEAPQLPPVLIEDMLRDGCKMLVSAASKAGKTFLMEQLAIAIAEGRSWLGKKCTQGKVLYFNLEVLSAEHESRLLRIYDALDIAAEDRHKENIHNVNLRGNDITPERLEQIIRVYDKQLKSRGEAYKVIIIDPLYKILTGDENNARDVAVFCNTLTRLAVSSGAAIVFVHHWSKAAVNNHEAVNRASGSGVLQRDPDAILDMSLVETTDDDGNDDGRIICRVSTVLRSFPPLETFHCEYKSPLHIIVDEPKLDYLPEQGSREAGSIKANRAKKQRAKDKLDGLISVINSKKEELLSHDISIRQVVEAQDWDIDTLYRNTKYKGRVRAETGLIISMKKGSYFIEVEEAEQSTEAEENND